MKTRLASLLVLLAGFCASALAAPSSAPAPTYAYGFNVNVVHHGPNVEIGRGVTRMTVLRLLGPAQRELAPDVWSYSGFRPEIGGAPSRGCDTLIVTFTDGRVSDLKIVNRPGAEVIAAKLQATSDVVQVAKK